MSINVVRIVKDSEKGKEEKMVKKDKMGLYLPY